ncbi:19570_t:CDS:2 [Racocetra fulgida]|uniref:Cleavage stimulation factor 50 kDa subunit n=1 Tax=Racocetra fulgida TaxID=60492 RepID=A0A9N9AD99_9GLOM|nr:19570_t:CDS:2 [Racocetra fulgida]
MDNLALYNEYDSPRVIISCYPMGEKVHLARSSSAPSYYVVESDYFKVRTIDVCRELDYFYDWLHPMRQNSLSENTVEIPPTIVENTTGVNEKGGSIQEDADTNAKEVNSGDENERIQKSADKNEENLEVYKDAEAYESEADTIVGSDVEDQLCEYGYTQLAQIVAEQTDSPVDLRPSPKLSELLYIAKEQDEGDEMRPCEMPEEDPDSGDSSQGDDGVYHSKYLTHVDPETRNGKYAATGSADASLKVLDTSKMNSRSDEDRPVIRTLYDHLAGVNDLSFHPNGLVLASCSDDQSIKLFDLSKPGVKRSFRYLQSIRAYDVKNFQCFTASTSPGDLHRGGITKVRFSANGSQFVTSSLDGSIKIWDTVTGRCVTTIENAHDGASVSSVKFSKTGKFILSGGRDSVARLWEAISGRCILQYEGATHKNNTLETTFTYNEDYVLSSDEVNPTVVCWDSRTGLLLKRWGGAFFSILYIFDFI